MRVDGAVMRGSCICSLILGIVSLEIHINT